MQRLNRYCITTAFSLLCCSGIFAQSTTVSGQVTDAGPQAWNNGTYSFVFVPNPQFPVGPYTWTGGTLNTTISGSLNATGGYSVSIPSNSSISPQGSKWTATFCPQASSPCFQVQNVAITGGTQTINATPPAIVINLATAFPPVLAYSTSEVTGAVIGSQFYLLGTGPQVCSAVSGNTCTTWSAVGGGVSFVSSLPATCTPGVTANVQGSVALTQTNQTYAAGTQFWCSATNTWSPVSSGISPGTFTNAQMNQPELTTTTGGGTCNPSTILGLGVASTVNLTDTIATCTLIPTSSVTNGFTNGFAAYMQNPNPNATGQFGWVGAVGYYDQIFCNGGGSAHCWGANFSVSDAASLPAVLFGNEYDVTVNSNSTTGAGQIMSYRGNGQPGTFPAFRVQTKAGTGAFTSALSTDDGSIASPYIGISLGKQLTGNGQDSQSIVWNAAQGSTAIQVNTHLLQDNFLIFGAAAANPMVVVADASAGATGNASGFGVTLKATAALTVNTLVKIDTANADSVVICTTADTSCDAFVAGGSVYCALGGTHCALISAPGMRAVGVVGTGTCAIGNFVIVDTTTNGRVKCQAGIPAQGAYIGKALSAQGSVGGTVDILTKFQ